MQSAALRALEFDRIREALAEASCTPLGRERAHTLEPAGDPAEVRARLASAAQASHFVRAGGSLALDAPESLADIMVALDLAGDPLDALQLLGLSRFLDSVEAVCGGITRRAETDAATPSGGIDRLRAIADAAASFEHETAGVRRAIEPGGDLKDTASPALRDIRESLRRQRAKLRSTLESLTRGRDAAKALQDQIITDRNGRYVVVVRAEHRDAIPGIVHGSSASGASLYVEPLTTVDLNNEIVGLAEREREEIRRILQALTSAFRDRADELARNLDVAGDLDELHAKTRLALRLGGVAPDLADDGRIEFRGARHPLLDDAGGRFSGASGENRPPASSHSKGTGLALRPATPVPSDLLVIPPTRALVISGPNTGGKTVALKAFGLLAIMAQAGILIPVEPGSRFTPFQSIFADIGDDQSIAASLSTFSARVAHVVEMDRALELPALVLLDEVGSGTDPIEGGALGTAVIDHFRRRGATVVATTHDDALKSYAATSEGVTTAAFGFDPDTYAPTYRLMYGVPGRSLALEIAERLGMPGSVIAAARARRSGRESELAAHLARVDELLAQLERERADAARERQAIAGERDRILERETRLAEREAILKKRLDDKLNERLREAKSEVDRIIGDVKQRAEALVDRAGGRTPVRGPVLSTGEVGHLRVEARAALDDVGRGVEGGDRPQGPSAAFDAPPAVGATVVIGALGAEAIVRGISGNRVDVEVRGKRMRVALADLRPVGSADAGPPKRPTKGGSGRSDGSGGTGRVSVESATRADTAAREIVLIGQTVDAAMDRLDKFLDTALLSDERRLRIVHGHGTGRLRDAVRAHFRGHPLVERVGAAPDNEGGDGATIVELRE